MNLNALLKWVKPGLHLLVLLFLVIPCRSQGFAWSQLNTQFLFSVHSAVTSCVDSDCIAKRLLEARLSPSDLEHCSYLTNEERKQMCDDMKNKYDSLQTTLSQGFYWNSVSWRELFPMFKDIENCTDSQCIITSLAAMGMSPSDLDNCSSVPRSVRGLCDALRNIYDQKLIEFGAATAIKPDTAATETPAKEQETTTKKRRPDSGPDSDGQNVDADQDTTTTTLSTTANVTNAINPETKTTVAKETDPVPENQTKAPEDPKTTRAPQVQETDAYLLTTTSRSKDEKIEENTTVPVAVTLPPKSDSVTKIPDEETEVYTTVEAKSKDTEEPGKDHVPTSESTGSQTSTVKIWANASQKPEEDLTTVEHKVTLGLEATGETNGQDQTTVLSSEGTMGTKGSEAIPVTETHDTGNTEAQDNEMTTAMDSGTKGTEGSGQDELETTTAGNPVEVVSITLDESDMVTGSTFDSQITAATGVSGATGASGVIDGIDSEGTSTDPRSEDTTSYHSDPNPTGTRTVNEIPPSGQTSITLELDDSTTVVPVDATSDFTGQVSLSSEDFGNETTTAHTVSDSDHDTQIGTDATRAPETSNSTAITVLNTTAESGFNTLTSTVSPGTGTVQYTKTSPQNNTGDPGQTTLRTDSPLGNETTTIMPSNSTLHVTNDPEDGVTGNTESTGVSGHPDTNLTTVTTVVSGNDTTTLAPEGNSTRANTVESGGDSTTVTPNGTTLGVNGTETTVTQHAGNETAPTPQGNSGNGTTTMATGNSTSNVTATPGIGDNTGNANINGTTTMAPANSTKVTLAPGIPGGGGAAGNGTIDGTTTMAPANATKVTLAPGVPGGGGGAGNGTVDGKTTLAAQTGNLTITPTTILPQNGTGTTTKASNVTEAPLGFCPPLFPYINIIKSHLISDGRLNTTQVFGTLIYHSCEKEYFFGGGTRLRIYECANTGQWTNLDTGNTCKHKSAYFV